MINMDGAYADPTRTRVNQSILGSQKPRKTFKPFIYGGVALVIIIIGLIINTVLENTPKDDEEK